MKDGCSARLPSLLEKIFKRLPRVVGSKAGRRGCFFFSRHPQFIECAIVADVFLFYPLRHRLHALEPAAGIEVRALLAGMQREATFGTDLARRHPLQNGPALRAPGDGVRARQIHRFWPHAVVASCGWDRRRLFAGFLARLYLTVTVLITMLTIFCCHTNLPQHSVYCRSGAVWTTNF